MQLTLRVLHSPGGVPPEPRQVDTDEYSIGRSDENDWVLDDPQRQLSKRHCSLALRAGRWQVIDLSTNGTFVNRAPQPLGRGQARILRDGDRLRLGFYEIEVRITEDETIYAGASEWLRRATIGSFGGDPLRDDPARPGAAGMPAPVRPGPVSAPLPVEQDPATLDTFNHPRGLLDAPSGPTEALLTGARLRDVPLPDAVAMHSLGAALRAIMGAVRDAAVSRAETRQVFRMKQTAPHTGRANQVALPDQEDEWLKLLLGAANRGPGDARATIPETLRDAVLHEAACRAGILAGVAALQSHLAPERIVGGASRALSAADKARAWDAMVALHASTLAVPLNSVDSVFGRAFAQAYEQAYEQAWAEKGRT